MSDDRNREFDEGDRRDGERWCIRAKALGLFDQQRSMRVMVGVDRRKFSRVWRGETLVMVRG